MWVDDAFEYLMSKAQKGEKGQYFTPRYVIDMCVKMMNPTVGDKIIDTACGQLRLYRPQHFQGMERHSPRKRAPGGRRVHGGAARTGGDQFCAGQ